MAKARQQTMGDIVKEAKSQPKQQSNRQAARRKPAGGSAPRHPAFHAGKDGGGSFRGTRRRGGN